MRVANIHIAQQVIKGQMSIPLKGNSHQEHVDVYAKIKEIELQVSKQTPMHDSKGKSKNRILADRQGAPPLFDPVNDVAAVYYRRSVKDSIPRKVPMGPVSPIQEVFFRRLVPQDRLAMTCKICLSMLVIQLGVLCARCKYTVHGHCSHKEDCTEYCLACHLQNQKEDDAWKGELKQGLRDPRVSWFDAEQKPYDDTMFDLEAQQINEEIELVVIIPFPMAVCKKDEKKQLLQRKNIPLPKKLVTRVHKKPYRKRAAEEAKEPIVGEDLLLPECYSSPGLPMNVPEFTTPEESFQPTFSISTQDEIKDLRQRLNKPVPRQTPSVPKDKKSYQQRAPLTAAQGSEESPVPQYLEFAGELGLWNPVLEESSQLLFGICWIDGYKDLLQRHNLPLNEAGPEIVHAQLRPNQNPTIAEARSAPLRGIPRYIPDVILFPSLPAPTLEEVMLVPEICAKEGIKEILSRRVTAKRTVQRPLGKKQSQVSLLKTAADAPPVRKEKCEYQPLFYEVEGRLVCPKPLRLENSMFQFSIDWYDGKTEIVQRYNKKPPRQVFRMKPVKLMPSQDIFQRGTDDMPDLLPLYEENTLQPPPTWTQPVEAKIGQNFSLYGYDGDKECKQRQNKPTVFQHPTRISAKKEPLQKRAAAPTPQVHEIREPAQQERMAEVIEPCSMEEVEFESIAAPFFSISNVEMSKEIWGRSVKPVPKNSQTQPGAMPVVIIHSKFAMPKVGKSRLLIPKSLFNKVFAHEEEEHPRPKFMDFGLPLEMDPQEPVPPFIECCSEQDQEQLQKANRPTEIEQAVSIALPPMHVKKPDALVKAEQQLIEAERTKAEAEAILRAAKKAKKDAEQELAAAKPRAELLLDNIKKAQEQAAKEILEQKLQAEQIAEKELKVAQAAKEIADAHLCKAKEEAEAEIQIAKKKAEAQMIEVEQARKTAELGLLATQRRVDAEIAKAKEEAKKQVDAELQAAQKAKQIAEENLRISEQMMEQQRNSALEIQAKAEEEHVKALEAKAEAEQELKKAKLLVEKRKQEAEQEAERTIVEAQIVKAQIQAEKLLIEAQLQEAEEAKARAEEELALLKKQFQQARENVEPEKTEHTREEAPVVQPLLELPAMKPSISIPRMKPATTEIDARPKPSILVPIRIEPKIELPPQITPEIQSSPLVAKRHVLPKPILVEQPIPLPEKEVLKRHVIPKPILAEHPIPLPEQEILPMKCKVVTPTIIKGRVDSQEVIKRHVVPKPILVEQPVPLAETEIMPMKCKEVAPTMIRGRVDSQEEPSFDTPLSPLRRGFVGHMERHSPEIRLQAEVQVMGVKMEVTETQTETVVTTNQEVNTRHMQRCSVWAEPEMELPTVHRPSMIQARKCFAGPELEERPSVIQAPKYLAGPVLEDDGVDLDLLAVQRAIKNAELALGIQKAESVKSHLTEAENALEDAGHRLSVLTQEQCIKPKEQETSEDLSNPTSPENPPQKEQETSEDLSNPTSPEKPPQKEQEITETLTSPASPKKSPKQKNQKKEPVSAKVTGNVSMKNKAGKTVPMFTIEVKAEGQQWTLNKDYSEFAELFKSLQDLRIYGAVRNFDFPAKDSFWQNTKTVTNLREKAFDELCRILVVLEPRPKEVQLFLNLPEEA